MKRSFLAGLCATALALVALSAGAAAQQREPEREPERGGGRSLVGEDGRVRNLPAMLPDMEAFRAAMEPGGATIRGNAHTQGQVKRRTGFTAVLLGVQHNTYPLNQQSVHLLPYNAYMEEWLRMAMEVLDPERQVYIATDPQVQALRREVITNSSGDFTFRNLRPGRYIIWATPEWEYGVLETRNHLTNRLVYDRYDFHYEIVDIDAGTDVVEVELVLKRILSQRLVGMEDA